MIRKATKKDGESILEMLLKAYAPEQHGSMRREVKNALDDYVPHDNITTAYVYEKQGKVIGYICLRNWSNTYWWDNMVIDEESQGQGIASKFTKFVKEQCVKDNVAQVNLWTFHNYLIPFYEKHEFEVRGQVKGPFPPRDKLRHMMIWQNPNYQS